MTLLQWGNYETHKNVFMIINVVCVCDSTVVMSRAR